MLLIILMKYENFWIYKRGIFLESFSYFFKRTGFGIFYIWNIIVDYVIISILKLIKFIKKKFENEIVSLIFI